MIFRFIRSTVLSSIVLAFMCTVYLATARAEDVPSAPQPQLLITEVQTGAPSAAAEFIELFNQSDAPINVSGYRLAYQAAAGTGNIITIVQLASSELWVDPGDFLLYVSAAYEPELPSLITPSGIYNTARMATDGGRVYLQKPGSSGWETIDAFLWGTALQSPSAPLQPEALESYKRCVELDDTFRNTQQSGIDFYASGYRALHGQLGELCKDLQQDDDPPDITDSKDPGDQNPEPTPTAPTLSCEGVIISEVLPNPAGADGGNEFIELHNPTNDFIDLKGCALQTNANTKLYTFIDSFELVPGQYIAFYSGATGLTLPNAAGGTVWLISAASDEISELIYPGNLQDDVAWALIDGVWQLSYVPSPSTANVYMPLKPCDVGQVRSETTNRCVNAASVVTTALVDCGPGRERNPETNRCRSVLAAATTLTPCRPGQERNPETNRCRNIASSQQTLTPCGPGQERNPETNRCRKIVAANDLAEVTDVATGPRANTTGWFIAGGVLLLAVGYGVYEWRKDIGRWLKLHLPFRRR